MSAKRLLDKLCYNSTENSEQNILSDMVIEFKSGLILLPILQHNSIILKNVSDLQPNVIKRFNELLKGKHSLTVSEDIYNTITESDTKELYGFSSTSRVFGTCNPNSAVKLPDSILKNFTIISTSEYTKEERKYVFKSDNDNDTSTESSNIGTPNSKLFEHVIWFSKVKALIDQIFEPDLRKQIFSNVGKLSKFPEMLNSAKLILKSLLDYFAEDITINSDDIDTVNSMLNAHFIMKLKNDNLFDNMETLGKNI